MLNFPHTMDLLCVILFFVTRIDVAWLKPQDSVAFTSPVLRSNRTTNYLDFAGKTYYFGTIFPATYYRAAQYCRQQGMQLVSIGSQAENDRLQRFAEEIGAHYEHFWTSGTNLASKDDHKWVWLSTGHNMIYSNWRSGEPTYKNVEGVVENCIEAIHYPTSFPWNDISCMREFFFICEFTNTCGKK